MNKKSIFKKLIAVIVVIVLVIGISIGTATVIHNTDTAPASTTVKNGLSAYELAVEHGYEGTVQEWLESLSGKSAYEVAAENGYTGTEAEFSATLAEMSNGETAAIKTAAFSSKGELLITLSDNTVINLGVAVGADGKDGAPGKDGADGKDGAPGKDGAAGKDGKDGVGISSAYVNDDGQFVINFSDGKSVNLDKLIGLDGEDGKDGADGKDGKDGEDGVGIDTIEINAAGELVIELTSGTTMSLGSIKGADGKDGEDGDDGVGISAAEINADGHLVLSFSNNTSVDLGSIKGADGQDGAAGPQGPQGPQGAQGAQGVGIDDVEISNDGVLSVTLTNSTVLTLGNVKGADGLGISAAEINADGELVLTYTNGSSTALGKVKGDAGEDGRGISNVTVDATGDLYITYSDSQTPTLLANIKGDKGDTGPQGPQGEAGADGDPGVDGKSAYELYKQAYPDYTGTMEEWLASLSGKDGRSITKTEIIDGHLWITYSDAPDTPVDVGNVLGNSEMDADGQLIYVLLEDGTYGVRASSTFALETLTILESYNNIAVTQILENGFENCTTITALSLPESITKIGRYAFYGCLNMTEVTIPASTYYIGAYAFYKSGLTSATLSDPDEWTVGTDGFNYQYIITAPTSGFNSINYRTYSISDTTEAAAALIGPVSLISRGHYDGKFTYTYADKNWYAVDWTRAPQQNESVSD